MERITRLKLGAETELSLDDDPLYFSNFCQQHLVILERVGSLKSGYNLEAVFGRYIVTTYPKTEDKYDIKGFRERMGGRPPAAEQQGFKLKEEDYVSAEEQAARREKDIKDIQIIIDGHWSSTPPAGRTGSAPVVHDIPIPYNPNQEEGPRGRATMNRLAGPCRLGRVMRFPRPAFEYANPDHNHEADEHGTKVSSKYIECRNGEKFTIHVRANKTYDHQQPVPHTLSLATYIDGQWIGGELCRESHLNDGPFRVVPL
ncbi:hypothetical protein PG984_006535 [Apiospora sp. TS-2023a]